MENISVSNILYLQDGLKCLLVSSISLRKQRQSFDYESTCFVFQESERENEVTHSSSSQLFCLIFWHGSWFPFRYLPTSNLNFKQSLKNTGRQENRQLKSQNVIHHLEFVCNLSATGRKYPGTGTAKNIHQESLHNSNYDMCK